MPRPTLDAAFERDYLLYALSGALRVSVAGNCWLLPPSFAAWVPANTLLRINIEKPVTTCSVLTTPGFCTRFPTTPVVFQMSPMARQMIQYCKDWGADTPLTPQAEQFFQTLLNVCSDLVAKSIDVRRPTSTDPTLRQAIDITEAHLADAITAGQVARKINMSERSMQRRFHKDVGMTWSETLTQLRMIHAAALLAEDRSSIIQIAGDVGFSSLSAFNRAFRKFAATTPTEFRNALLG
ncbi:helix-turn-helix transcriptional regulator [Aliiroseovarius sp. F20344]|uniref:AraC family transcriptional regulator n=1 Tax=Aliiroseovarius sp. F20344 TaxID=2926414 RepID=UPI001FF28465|nr:helix-turn-helix transcriptional regulator [Aliiroseovarius sp. F20344]MCK0140887.1 helix-turn-helix transcriptional regulator [Aliiroseovarius sp. F20344]